MSYPAGLFAFCAANGYEPFFAYLTTIPDLIMEIKNGNGMVKMEQNSLETLMRQNKGKVKNIGLQSEELGLVRRVMNGGCPDEERLFAVQGIWAHQKLSKTEIPIRAFLFCPEMIYSGEAFELIQEFTRRADKVYLVSRKVMEKLSDRDEPDGLLSVGEFPVCGIASREPGEDSVVVVLDGLETPGNIGTIIRTCDGAGVDAVFICNKRARLTNPKLIKGSMGAAFVVPIAEFAGAADCIAWLHARNYTTYLADTRAEISYKNCEFPGRTALVMGSERYGISREWYDHGLQTLSIPMFGVCDSLNVGTAASILLYEISLKKRAMKCQCHLVKE